MPEYEAQVQKGVEAARACLASKFPGATIAVTPEIGGAYKFHFRSLGRPDQTLTLSEDLLADSRTEGDMLDALVGRGVLNRLTVGEIEVSA